MAVSCGASDWVHICNMVEKRKERNEVKIQIRKESTSHSVYGVS